MFAYLYASHFGVHFSFDVGKTNPFCSFAKCWSFDFVWSACLSVCLGMYTVRVTESSGVYCYIFNGTFKQSRLLKHSIRKTFNKGIKSPTFQSGRFSWTISTHPLHYITRILKLKHWGGVKITAILQATLLNIFLSEIFRIFDQRAQPINETNDFPDDWRIYASLSPNMLTPSIISDNSSKFG